MAKNSSLPSNASQSYGIKSEGGRSNEVGFDKYKERELSALADLKNTLEKTKCPPLRKRA